MTSYLYRDPDLVVLDIPGTGCDLLRAALGPPTAERLASGFGDVRAPRVAVVRHPLARFRAAVEGYRSGDPQDPDAPPQLPELTIDQALDILENPKVPVDGSRNYAPAHLKRAMAPQTAPIFRLFEADHILRAEVLAEDWAALPDDLRKADADLTPPETPELELSDQALARLNAVYETDYAALGYSADTPTPVADPTRPDAPGPQPWDVWPTFFDRTRVTADIAERALPEIGADLSPLATAIVGGRAGNTWAGREPNLIRHFRNLQPEFSNQSRLAHLLAACIVVLRRCGDQPGALALFHKITTAYGEQLASEMKMRWLVSVCDTFADHGTDTAQRATGIAGSLLANTIKLTETERKIFNPARPWPPKKRWGSGGPLFDGLITYWLERGEMIELMVKRLDAICADVPGAGPFAQEIMVRAHRHDTVFRRFGKLAGKKSPPRIDAKTKRDITEILKDVL